MSRNLGYGELLRALFHAGFTRVERDDRLLDIFPDEDREKGIELWEHWLPDTIEIARVVLPWQEDSVTRHTLPRPVIEAALIHNQELLISDFVPSTRRPQL